MRKTNDETENPV